MISVDYDDDVLTIRRRPLGFRIALWAFVAFSATVLIISRTQPALAADLKAKHGFDHGSVATAGSGQVSHSGKSGAGNGSGAANNGSGGNQAATSAQATTGTSAGTSGKSSSNAGATTTTSASGTAGAGSSGGSTDSGSGKKKAPALTALSMAAVRAEGATTADATAPTAPQAMLLASMSDI